MPTYAPKLTSADFLRLKYQREQDTVIYYFIIVNDYLIMGNSVETKLIFNHIVDLTIRYHVTTFHEIILLL